MLKKYIMEKEFFYEFSQLNSGGDLIVDHEHGVGSSVIIQSTSFDNALNKLFTDVSYEVDGFFDYCECCGHRWTSWYDRPQPKDVPCIRDTPLTTEVNGKEETYFVHYSDGRIERMYLKNKH